VKRPLIYSSSFQRRLKKLLNKQPEYLYTIQAVLPALANNAHDPSLNTHKLKGNLKGTWSCSAGYDLRIIFEFLELNGQEHINLISIGSHDEVY
jgi:addiction module RelE/StbE family toxin